MKWDNQEDLEAKFVVWKVCSEIKNDVHKFKYAIAIFEDFYLVLIYNAMMSDMINNNGDQAP